MEAGKASCGAGGRVLEGDCIGWIGLIGLVGRRWDMLRSVICKVLRKWGCGARREGCDQEMSIIGLGDGMK